MLSSAITDMLKSRPHFRHSYVRKPVLRSLGLTFCAVLKDPQCGQGRSVLRSSIRDKLMSAVSNMSVPFDVLRKRKPDKLAAIAV